MTRSRNTNILQSHPNPEKLFRTKNKDKIESSRLDFDHTEEVPKTPISSPPPEPSNANRPPMEARVTMEDLMKATREGLGQSITQPAINQDFEIKGPILHLIKESQFRGLPNEDANEHLRQFNEICNLFKIRAVEDETIYLRLFPWSLKDEARTWLKSLPVGEITTWTQMVEKFLGRFFPASKTVDLQAEITNFKQKPTETLYMAWTRFGQLLRACPQHGLTLFQRMTTFYKGTNVPTRQKIDIAAGGNIMTKTAQEANDIIDKLAAHSHEWHEESNYTRSASAIDSESEDLMKSMSVQMNNLGRQMEKITKEMHAIKIGCEKCGGPHLTKECVNGLTMEQMENISFVSIHQNYQGGNPNLS